MVHVLLLEDSTHIHRVVNLILGGHAGIHIDIVSTPQQAQASLGVMSPHLIICSGRFFGPQTPLLLSQFLLKARSTHAQCQALILLGTGDNQEDFLTCGLENFIKKPFTSEELATFVENLLGSPKEVREIPPVLSTPTPPHSSTFDLDDLDFRFQSSISGHMEDTPSFSTRSQTHEPKVTLDLNNLGPLPSFGINEDSPLEPPGPQTTVKPPLPKEFDFTLRPEENVQDFSQHLTPHMESDKRLPWAIDPVPPQNLEPPIEEVKTHNLRPRHSVGDPHYSSGLGLGPLRDDKKEIQKIIDAALYDAIETTLPDRIDKKIEAGWDNLVQSTVSKMAPQIERSMELKVYEWTKKEFKNVLKEAVLQELKIILDRIST